MGEQLINSKYFLLFLISLPTLALMKLLNDSGYLTGWLKVQTPAMVRFESKDNHRIMKWLMLEATSGGHLVQFPYSSKATRIGVPRTMSR